MRSFNLKGKSIPELIANVINTFNNYPSDALERCHALKFEVYRQILKCDGGNDYDIPHTQIRQRQYYGEDVVDLEVDEDDVNRAREWIAENDNTKK
jgi:hypothetical protein